MLQATIDKTNTMYEQVTAEDATAAKIAHKSSINVIPMNMRSVIDPYVMPHDLVLALQLKEDDSQLTTSAKDYMKILPCLAKFRSIKSKHYWFLMKLLLYLDHYQCILEMEQYTLYKQKIVLSKLSRRNVVIRVPELSERRPSIMMKDEVLIMQENGRNNLRSNVTFVGKSYVTVSVTKMFAENLDENQLYNIYFSYPTYAFMCAHYAVDKVIVYNLFPILFPKDEPVSKLQRPKQLVWVNERIKENLEQQQAIINILDRTAFPAAYILFGPPGTGKTMTLVEAINQILKDPSNRILVCTPSNAAGDEIGLRLLKSNIERHHIHRLYSVSREGKDINDELKDCSNYYEESTTLISKEIFITKKVVIATLITCSRLAWYNLRENHFSYVFIDEAGQATEPDTLIPLTLMSSKRASHRGRLHGQLVIAGDPQQLGPIIQSKIAEPLLARSMLERLMKEKLYSKDEHNKYNPLYVTKLVQNYRSHPAILHLPNELFYDGDLKAFGGVHTERALDWPQLPKRDFPVIFHAVNGKEQRSPRSPSTSNPDEVAVIVSYVKNLLHSNLGGKPLSGDEIGIVTPYSLQRQRVREALEANKMAGITVGTVETFQGQERDCIIISTVRSALCSYNGRIHIGFLANPKRFNVALTRAKALLIVIGNPMILQVDHYWRLFIRYCADHGACAGPKFSLTPLNRKELRQLVAKKHVVAPLIGSDASLEAVEEKSIEKKGYCLPKKNNDRRRRLPKRENGVEPFIDTKVDGLNGFDDEWRVRVASEYLDTYDSDDFFGGDYEDDADEDTN